jgi:hypothetical protein
LLCLKSKFFTQMKKNFQKPRIRSESLLWRTLNISAYLMGCIIIFLFSSSIAMGQIPANNASANLDQGANGPAFAHTDPFEWQNGNLNPNQAHQVEGHSIPYRIIMEDIPYEELNDLGIPVELIIEYDIKHSGYHALDFLTTYRYLPYHDIMWPDHDAEEVIPWAGVFTDEPVGEHYTHAVPPPDVNILIEGAQQPLTAFNACTCPKEIHGWYANIINVEYVDMGYTSTDLENESKLAQQVKITFIPNNDVAIISFGGHIASRLDWGYDSQGEPLSAGGISGSPYHMRLIDWNLNNLGNQDRSLSGATVVEPCEVEVTVTGSEICVGFDGTITAEASGGTPPYHFVLLDNDVQIAECSSSDEPGVCIFTLSPTATTAYTVEVTDSKECGATDDATIIVYPLPEVTLDGAEFCIDADPVQLEGEPDGGSYSGPGVTVDGLFTPADAGVGEHTIIYCYEDGHGCGNCAEAIFVVYPLPEVTLDGAEFCIDADPVQLAGEPDGGSYSGPGVSTDGLFDPNAAGAGEHTITYCYEDEHGCRDCAEAVFVVYPLPEVTLDGAEFCIDADPVQLAGEPAGGSYSGPGVTVDGLFTPADAGVGEHTIIYCFEDEHGCGNCAEAVIVVYPLPEVTLDGAEFCLDADPVQLAGEPAGGSYSGPGVSTGGLFDPNAAGAGEHTITYCYEDGHGCRDCAEAVLIVYPLPEVTASNNSPLCFYDEVLELYETGGDAVAWSWTSDGSALITNPSDQNPTASGFADGEEFTVVITDINGCTSTATTTIIVDPELSCDIDLLNPPIICGGVPAVPGQAEVYIMGGTPPYVIEWSNGESGPMVPVNESGEICCYVTDIYGCETSCCAVVQAPPPPTCTISIEQQPQDCPGMTEVKGVATVYPENGTPPYTYMWNNGETTETAYNLDAGPVWVMVWDDNQCETLCEEVLEPLPCPQGFCFYTQGFYGNEGGLGWTVDCDMLSAMEMMQMVLPGGENEIFGVELNNLYFTLFGTDISNYSIFKMLPGGKKAQPLTGIATYGSAGTWGYVPIETKSKKKYGTINNILLSQAITFYFNLGHNPESVNFGIGGNRLVTAPSDCLFEEFTLEKDTFNIPQSVVDYLGENNTLGDLLQLAKNVLGDDYDPGMVSPEEVAYALDAFNNGFDECRAFVEFYSEPESKTGHYNAESIFDLAENEVKIYPNPFSRFTRFEFGSSSSEHLTLELYDLKGTKIRTLFDKPVKENQIYYVDFDGSALLNGTYFYRLISDQKVTTGKLIKIWGY